MNLRIDNPILTFATRPSERNADMTSTSRRQFNQLAWPPSAVRWPVDPGLFAATSRRKRRNRRPPRHGKAGDRAAAKNYDENLLLVGDPHVCRGLNQCKNQGKTK